MHQKWQHYISGENMSVIYISGYPDKIPLAHFCISGKGIDKREKKKRNIILEVLWIFLSDKLLLNPERRKYCVLFKSIPISYSDFMTFSAKALLPQLKSSDMF